MKPEPEILLHPNIPKPLHGLNPRTIMGIEWWDVERRKAYASTDFHCAACGVHKSKAIIHQWLEAHEYYRFHYSLGMIEIEKIIPLCHACHNYIHSGRLMKIVLKKEISRDTFWQIVRHGTIVLRDSNLPNNPFMLAVLHSLHGKFLFPNWAEDLLSYPVDFPSGGEEIPWGNWRLKFNGKEYKPLHSSFDEWKNHYK